MLYLVGGLPLKGHLHDLSVLDDNRNVSAVVCETGQVIQRVSINNDQICGVSRRYLAKPVTLLKNAGVSAGC